MSTFKKGMLTVSREYARHLRQYGKREFWSKERSKEKQAINKQLESEGYYLPEPPI